MKKLVNLILIGGILYLSGCSFWQNKISVDTSKDSTGPVTTQVTAPTDNGLKTDLKETGISVEAEPLPSEKPGLSAVIYYQDKDGQLIPVTRTVGKQEGIAKAMISGLIDDSLNREEIETFGLYPTLPEGTKVLGMDIKEGVATVDFNNRLLEYKNETGEKNMVASIVYTLTEFKNIRGVKILVNGYKQQKLKYNTNISDILSRENVWINTDPANTAGGTRKLDIYFLKNLEKKSFLVPVSVPDNSASDIEVPNNIILLLSKGLEDKRIRSELPSGTKLIDSNNSNGVLTLNFNSGVALDGKSIRADVLKQILYSTRQLKNIETVRILVDGKDINIHGSTGTDMGISLPHDINFIEEL